MTEAVNPQALAEPASLRQATRRSAMVGGLLALAGGGALALTPRRREVTLAGKLVDALPHRVGGWSEVPADGVIVPEETDPGDYYDQVVARSFHATGAPEIMMLAAYGAAQRGLIRVHRPEVCYASAGFGLHGAHGQAVPLGAGHAIPGRTFTAERDGRREQVLFWTRVGDSLTLDSRLQKVAMLRRGLQGVIPDGLLVRLSVVGMEPAAAVRVLTAFGGSLVAAATPAARVLLVGPPSATSLG